MVRRLRLVVDTNVLVSALLTPGRPPDKVLEAIVERGDVLLCDDRIEAEYRGVLARPKFKAIAPGRIDTLLKALFAVAERVSVEAPFAGPMKDPDDRVFVEVALGGRADALVTGNGKDYPAGLGFEVLEPTAFLRMIGGA